MGGALDKALHREPSVNYGYFVGTGSCSGGDYTKHAIDSCLPDWTGRTMYYSKFTCTGPSVQFPVSRGPPTVITPPSPQASDRATLRWYTDADCNHEYTSRGHMVSAGAQYTIIVVNTHTPSHR